MKLGDKILIGGIAVMSITSIALLMKNKAQKIFNKTKKTGHMFYNTVSGHIVSIPNAEQDSYSLLLVFGGIPPYGGDWMKSQIPNAVFEKYVVVLPKYHNSTYDNVVTEYTALLDKKQITISDKSIFGFSGGALRAQENISKENWAMVGLIDPSTRSAYLTLPFSAKVKMIYNAANWGGYPSIKALLPQLAAKINAAGGYAESKIITHLDIPKYFFNKIILNT